jgi:hypothetical protein
MAVPISNSPSSAPRTEPIAPLLPSLLPLLHWLRNDNAYDPESRGIYPPCPLLKLHNRTLLVLSMPFGITAATFKFNWIGLFTSPIALCPAQRHWSVDCYVTGEFGKISTLKSTLGL